MHLQVAVASHCSPKYSRSTIHIGSILILGFSDKVEFSTKVNIHSLFPVCVFVNFAKIPVIISINKTYLLFR